MGVVPFLFINLAIYTQLVFIISIVLIRTFHFAH